VPLGASITQGWDIGTVESLQNGYRKPLRQELRHRGYAVNMVGSRAHGDFSDRQHEGWPGLKIDDVALKMLPVMTSQKPNLMLILLGSNDCFQGRRENNMDYARTMKDRMRNLIGRVYSTSSDITIILATIPPTTDAGNEPYIQTANVGYKELSSELQRHGRKIELVNMYTTWLKPEDYSDSIHFKPQGYAKLAALFADGFSRAEKKGWLTAPIDTGIGDSAGCYTDVNSQRNTRSPPYWNLHPHVLDTKLDSKSVDVGDWDGDGLCDILTVDRATGNVDMWRNVYKKGDASPTFDAPVPVVDRNLCPQTMPPSDQNDPAVHFGDLDGDLRVDVSIPALPYFGSV
jgi:lysophospholipase L1-like esterase